jgi:hypothetical protein
VFSFFGVVTFRIHLTYCSLLINIYRKKFTLTCITLEIDEGSDGTIDQTIILDNELLEIYLPIIMMD